MKKFYFLTFYLFSCYVAHSQCCSNGINLLADYNPDFSAPFTDIPPGFITDNPYTTIPTPGTYIIVASRNYGACFNTPQTDHTTGDPINGRFLWFDTSPTASPATPDIAWKPFNPNLPPGTESLIAVASNTTYVFSCWIRDLARNPDCITGGAPLMGLRINGQELAEIDLALVTEPCCPQWTYLCAEWNSGNNTTALIQIESRRNDGFNDLGIDDVYFGTTAPFDFSLGPDKAVCLGSSITLTDTTTNSTALWSNGSTESQIEVSAPGIYWLEVSKNNCTDRDSILITQLFPPSIFIGNDTLLCEQQQLSIIPINSGGEIENYLWQNSSTSNTLVATSSGLYWLQASNDCGISRDSILVNYFNPPDLGNDLSLCDAETAELNAGFASNYLWSTGASSSSIIISSAGTYWVETSVEQCIGSDTVSVLYFQTPTIDLGADTSYCDQEIVALTAGPATSYIWSDGATEASINISGTGLYWVQAFNGPCSVSDSITITLNSTPVADLGSDTSICQNGSLTLTSTMASDYLWSNGATSSSIEVTIPGLYWVQVSNGECANSDSLLITLTNCECISSIAMPNAFTPNNDGFNDAFKPLTLECVNAAELRIFNRWGNQIFVTQDLKNGWDGQSRGYNSPDGTYYWILDYQNSLNESLSQAGFVHLQRK